MNKAELVSAIAAKAESTKGEAESFLDAFIETVSDTVLKNGDSISLPGLGMFKQKKSAARTGRNPRTGESVQVSAKTSIAFKMSSALKK